MRTVVQDHHISILADLGMEHRPLDSLVMCFTKVSKWVMKYMTFTIHLFKILVFNDILME